MFIWRGYGAVTIGVVFASSLAANFLANLIGGPRYWDTHGWPIAVSFCVAAVALLFVDIALAKRRPRSLIDEATGERVIIHQRHDFLFLPIRWWALILVGLAVFVALTGWAPGPR